MRLMIYCLFFSIFIVSACSSVAEEDNSSSDINLQDLTQHWVHSREEDLLERDGNIYRPKDYKEFPPSRFRMEHIFKQEGRYQWLYLAPNDGHYHKSGKWQLDDEDDTIIIVTEQDQEISRYHILELNKELLRLERIETVTSNVSPYSGDESREIKALSESDIAGLLAGKGMGYAKAAELNGYPGPSHVLELADKLKLADEQRKETKAVFNQMQDLSKELGAELVAAERALDRAFKDKSIESSSLSELVTKIGNIESQLRAVHLNAHLLQTQILDEHQIKKYMMLRGYNNGGHGEGHKH